MNKDRCIRSGPNSLGGDLLSHARGVVPSALRGLTAVFGMGTGDPSRHSHPKSMRFVPSKLPVVCEDRINQDPN